jgi:hypothetical protein
MAVSATSLRCFQDGFAAALLDPEPGYALAPEIAALVRQPGFAVYRNTTIKGCIDALQANYPAVARLVGDEWFRACAAVYVRANLPTEPTLLHYGAGFAAFLAAFEPASELPYLPGVARLDRFWTEAHAARDQALVDAATLAGIAPGMQDLTVLLPHASSRWAWFHDAPIFTIWRRNRAAGPYDDGEIAWHGEGALLVRPFDVVRSIALDRAECALLDACAAGCTIGESLRAARHAVDGADAAGALRRLVDAGTFGSMTLRKPRSRRNR